MGRFANQGSGNFTPAPEGTHVARCIKIIDLGTQHGQYNGKANTKNQIIVFWELPNEMIDTDNGQQPATATKFYTNSLNEKSNLCADLQAWRGKKFTDEELASFDLMKILGAPCMITIIHDGDKAKVNAVTAMPKGMKCPEQINPSFSFWIEEWNDAEFDKISDGIKKIIKESDEYKAMHPSAPATQQKPANGAAYPRTRETATNRGPVPVPYDQSDEHFADDDIPF